MDKKVLPKVVIVLVNYNGWKDTEECILSIEKNNYNKFMSLIMQAQMIH